MTLSAGARFGPYEILSPLGAGGMGQVFRARDTKLQRDVAIKVLPAAFTDDAERVARFRREAQLLASLNHPNIAAIYGLEESDGVVGLALELVEGEDLAERMSRGAIPVDEAIAIARELASGLEAAHEKGIVHRDLKPANVKLTKDGGIKILDFGLAKAYEGDWTHADIALSQSPTISRPMTEVGILLGTAAYMSPEQARGRAVDKRADIWAFGVVLWEMLAGRRLFTGETASDTLAAVLKTDPDSEALPNETPPSVRRVLLMCLDKDPRRRLRDIGDLGLFLASEPAGPATPSVERVRFRPWIAALALLVVGVIAGVVIGRSKPEAPRPVARFVATPPSTEPLSLNQTDVGVSITPDGTRIVYLVSVEDQTDVGVSITPDGTRIVYLVSVEDRRQLVVRALDRLDAVPLSGLGNEPRGPFLSPDGDWVGYFDGEVALRKVSINGGPPVNLCAIPGGAPRGASWGADGTIVFATLAPTGLWRVSADGGKPEELTTPDPGKGDHQWPEILPGSKAVLFTILTQPVEKSQIAALSLTTGESRVLVAGGSNPRYVPTGHLVYGLGGKLWAAGFDLERLEVTSDAMPVLEGIVTKPSGAAEFGIARDGSLVFIEGPPGGDIARQLVWVDRQGREEALTAPPRNYFYPRLSPDGRRLALDVREQQRDIWMWDFARETLTRLTFGPQADMNPTWTPDGLRVAFSSTGINLFWKAADGTGNMERLAESANAQSPQAFSPDGKRLVFSEEHPERRLDLGMLSLEGGKPSVSLLGTEFNEVNAEISPDGRFLAYQSDESGQYEIYLRPFPDVEEGRWQVSRDGGTRPLWARNGRELFYMTSEGLLMAVPVQTSPAIAIGNPEVIFDRAYYAGNPGRTYDVSPDGERFLMIKEGGASGGPSQAELIFVLNWGEELKRLVPPGN